MKNFLYISILMILLNNIINAQEAIPVTAGWNLVSPCCCDTDIDLVTTVPPDIIEPGTWFNFTNTYNQVEFLNCTDGYWVKVSMSGVINICPEECPSTVYYEGKTYNTVLIEDPIGDNDQCWLKENLDVGTMILGSQNQTNNGGTNIIEKYCYNDDPANCNTYGGLYQWDEAMQYVTTSGAQGICPPGWHIPKLAEFQTLSTNVGGDGNALKREDQGSGGGQGTNTSGFSALLAGRRDSPTPPIFLGLDFRANFWSSTETTTSAYKMDLIGSNNGIDLEITNRDYGFSVRCIKD